MLLGNLTDLLLLSCRSETDSVRFCTYCGTAWGSVGLCASFAFTFYIPTILADSRRTYICVPLSFVCAKLLYMYFSGLWCIYGPL